MLLTLGTFFSPKYMSLTWKLVYLVTLTDKTYIFSPLASIIILCRKLVLPLLTHCRNRTKLRDFMGTYYDCRKITKKWIIFCIHKYWHSPVLAHHKHFFFLVSLPTPTWGEFREQLPLLILFPDHPQGPAQLPVFR